jgi:predicted amidohydrolase
VKVAAYQAPLLRSGSLEAVDLIRTRVEWCESHGVVILCCPEAILGGLADYAADPREFAIDALMVSKGATALFIPTNNGLPPEKAEVVAHARSVDIALAKENNIWVIRADVSGRTNGMVSYGTSGIIDPHGNVLQSPHQLTEELIVADLEVSPPEPTAMR